LKCRSPERELGFKKRASARDPAKLCNDGHGRHTTPQSVARAGETAILLRWPCPRLLIVQFRAFIDTLRLCPPVAHRPKLLHCRCSPATGSRPSGGFTCLRHWPIGTGERPWRLGLLRLPTPRSASGCAQRPPLRDRPVSLCPQLRAVSCGGMPQSAAPARPRAPETGRPPPRPYARRTIAPRTRS